MFLNFFLNFFYGNPKKKLMLVKKGYGSKKKFFLLAEKTSIYGLTIYLKKSLTKNF